MIIYKITNLVNNKIYIGQTIVSISERWTNHCYPKSNCIALRNAISKYGKDNFKIEQIDQAQNQEELDRKEQEWISKLQSTNPTIGYNLLSGGSGGSKHSEATKNKMSKSRIGKKMTKKTRDTLLKANSGRKMPEHVKEALRLANLNKGTISEETRKKLSETSKGRPKSQKQIQWLINYNKNRTLSPESLAKMAEANRKPRTKESIEKQKETIKRKREQALTPSHLNNSPSIDG